MPITISPKPEGALSAAQFQQMDDVTHIECGNAVRLLDSGKVQCLTCLKVGFPRSA